ncbi:lantibiotic dehydratase [Streptomyces xanthophaeus]|uniref:lantibiotic dehydratase n=1 Tax=Streptomyces xanthophaeus TaxID=67385 RepID=UPI0036B07F5D
MWSMMPHAILRSTGFPFELVESLRLPASAEAAATAVRAEHELLALAAEAGWDADRLDETRARAESGLLRLGPDERDRPAWVAAVTRMRAARRALETAAAEEEGRGREALAALARDARLREALAVSNPRILADLDRRGESAQLTHQLASFVQRVCTKNETVSFFGPINYATLDEKAPTVVQVSSEGPGTLRARRAHAASWVVSAVVEAVAFDPAVGPWLALRPRNPGVARPPGAPDSPGHRLLGLSDGRHTLAALADRLGVTPQEAVAEARALCRAGVAVHQLEPPATDPDPLAFLVRRLAAVPGAAPLVTRLTELISLRDGFCADDAQNKAERHRVFLDAARRIAPDCATASSRTGAFYTDRMPLREECAGTTDLRLGGAAVRELQERVVPALDFLATLAHRRRELARRGLAQRIGDRTVPLWKLVAAADGLAQPPDRELLAAVRDAVADPDAPEVDLAASAALTDMVRGTPLDESGAVCSVDLMIAADSATAWERGRYEVVLGDVHDTCLLTDWALQFHPEAARIRTARDAAMAGAFGRRPAVNILAGRQTGIPPLELPGPVVELGGLSDRSNPWTAELRDLVVRGDGHTAQLWSTPLGGEVTLHNGELDTVVQTAFAPLRLRAPGLNLGPHTPRLRWGRAVVQRESWTVPSSDLAALAGAAQRSTSEALLAVRRIWARHHLPDHAFVHLPGVRKPLFVDSASPALTRSLARACRRAADGAAPDALVRVSEMLPGADELWLADGGGRHTAELRCVFTRAVAAAGAGGEGTR